MFSINSSTGALDWGSGLKNNMTNDKQNAPSWPYGSVSLMQGVYCCMCMDCVWLSFFYWLCLLNDLIKVFLWCLFWILSLQVEQGLNGLFSKIIGKHKKFHVVLFHMPLLNVRLNMFNYSINSGRKPPSKDNIKRWLMEWKEMKKWLDKWVDEKKGNKKWLEGMDGWMNSWNKCNEKNKEIKRGME